MEGQRGAGGFDDGAVGIGVVKVGMGVEHVPDRETMARDLGQDALRVSAGIDDGPLFCLLAADYIAVGLDQADG